MQSYRAREHPAEGQFADQTRWGRTSEMDGAAVGRVLREVMQAAASANISDFTSMKNDFMLVLDRLIELSRSQDSYVVENVEPLFTSLDAIREITEAFLAPNELEKVIAAGDAVGASSPSAFEFQANVGLRPGGMPGEMPIPMPISAPTTRITIGQDAIVVFNEKWARLYGGDADRLGRAQSLAGRAAALSGAAERNESLMDEARSAGEAFYQDIEDNVRNLNPDLPANFDLSDPRTWGSATEFIRDRFGFGAEYDEDIANFLGMLRNGQLTEALRMLRDDPAYAHLRDSTFTYMLLESLSGGLNASQLHFVDLECNIDGQFSFRTGETFVVSAMFFLDILRSRSYRIDSSIAEDGTIVINGAPSVTEETQVGGGGGVGGQFNLGNRRYIDVTVLSGVDAQTDEVLTRLSAQYTDQSGNPLGIPMDGKGRFIARVETTLVEENVVDVTLTAVGQVSIVTSDFYDLMLSVGGSATFTPESRGEQIPYAERYGSIELGVTNEWRVGTNEFLYLHILGGVNFVEEGVSGGQVGAGFGARGMGDIPWNVELGGRAIYTNILWAPYDGAPGLGPAGEWGGSLMLTGGGRF